MKEFKILLVGLAVTAGIMTTAPPVQGELLPNLEGGDFSAGVAISDSGMAVGIAADGETLKAVKWDVTAVPVQAEILPPLAGNNYSAAYSVNDNQIIVGESGTTVDEIADATTAAVYWQNDLPALLPAPEGSTGPSAAHSINNGNLIVGESFDAAAGTSMAILWDEPSETANILSLHQPDWEYSSAYFIHDDGIIAGEAKPVDLPSQGVIWTPLSGTDYTVTLLPPAAGDIASIALGLAVPATDAEMPSKVVGETIGPDGTVRGIVWTLNMQGDQITGVETFEVATSAQTINDFDAIVGYTAAATGSDRASAWNLNSLDSHLRIADVISQGYAVNHANEVVGIQNGQALLASATIAFGQSLIGVFRNGTWYLDTNGNGGWNPGTDAVYSFGLATDRPVVGDWNGDDVQQIATFRNGTWYLDANRNGVWDPATDSVYNFGQAGDVPVAGNWNGSNADRIGVFRSGTWYLDENGNGVWDSGSDGVFHFGQTGDRPVVGDWNGDGNDQIGVFRSGTWYLDLNNNGAWDPGVDGVYSFGQTGDLPVAGAWASDGRTRIGVLRAGVWYLDQDGDGAWNAANDMVFRFGTAGDQPVAGTW